MNTRQLDRFFSSLKQQVRMVRNAQRERDLFIARDFSVFDYIEPNEPKVSQIVADLLRPNGEHGQGVVFLAEFLKQLGAPVDARLEDARIETETPTVHIPNSKKRVDILIDLTTSGVGVESKAFGAEDQPGQLAAYASELEERFRGRFTLLYLSRDSTGPSSESLNEGDRQALEAAGKLVVRPCLRFLKAWLEACEKASKADKVRWFLRDFSAFLGTIGEQDEGGSVATKDGDAELILSYALKDKDDLEIALRIGAQFEEIRRAVIKRFSDMLADYIRNALGGSWQIENRGMFDKQDGIRIFKPTWPKDWWVELAPDLAGGRSVFVGVRNMGSSAVNETVKQQLDVLKRGSTGGTWPWYFYLRPPCRDWDSPDLLVKMYEKDTGLLDSLTREILPVIEVVGPVIDELTAAKS